jgi:hypothetical protein
LIKYGLKLWTNDDNLFDEAVSLFKKEQFDFLELYHNANEEFDFRDLEKLKKIPTTVHAFHQDGFHEFKFNSKELEIWNKTKELADYFNSERIVVHAGKARNIDDFRSNLSKIDDPRILIENMAGLDVYGNLTFGYNLENLKKIQKEKEICFDLEKVIKSACYQRIDYKKFIEDCLRELKPNYFHISGGDFRSVKDEHLNLQEANFDLKWIKDKLNKLFQEKDIFLVFEVPKNESDLENDIKNMNYFKNI